MNIVANDDIFMHIFARFYATTEAKMVVHPRERVVLKLRDRYRWKVEKRGKAWKHGCYSAKNLINCSRKLFRAPEPLKFFRPDVVRAREASTKVARFGRSARNSNCRKYPGLFRHSDFTTGVFRTICHLHRAEVYRNKFRAIVFFSDDLYIYIYIHISLKYKRPNISDEQPSHVSSQPHWIIDEGHSIFVCLRLVFSIDRSRNDRFIPIYPLHSFGYIVCPSLSDNRRRAHGQLGPANCRYPSRRTCSRKRGKLILTYARDSRPNTRNYLEGLVSLSADDKLSVPRYIYAESPRASFASPARKNIRNVYLGEWYFPILCWFCELFHRRRASRRKLTHRCEASSLPRGEERGGEGDQTRRGTANETETLKVKRGGCIRMSLFFSDETRICSLALGATPGEAK